MSESLKKIFATFQTEGYVEYKIAKGQVMVNFEKVDPDYVLKPEDIVSHLLHMHETPCLDWPIEVIHEDEDKLVVNKPPSYVTYPLAATRMNSLSFILAKEKGYRDLRSINRLDRLTSGVIIFAKVREVSQIYYSLFS